MEILSGLLSGFQNQTWYQIAGEIVVMASAISASMPARWKDKANGGQRTWYKWLYKAVDFLAVNVFHAKTDPADHR